jgi:hypothetical protein
MESKRQREIEKEENKHNPIIGNKRMLWHVDPLIDTDRGISKYTRAVAR